LAWSRGPLRATVGLRADAIGVDVDSETNALNSGRTSDVQLSPKFTLAWRVADPVELYVDAGRGFHSNDARGAVQEVSPATLEPVDKAPLFAPSVGAEVGARYQQGGFAASVSLWTLRLASELVYAGDSGDTESTDSTRRLGGELLVSWSPRPGLNLDFSSAVTHARYRGLSSGGDRIPNALEYVVTGGVTYRLTPASLVQLTARRLGPAPLIEDNSARSKPSTSINAAYTYAIGPATISLEVLNLFDSRDHDITYFYTSRLRGEPAEGVDDEHFHPMEPRQFRLGLRYGF
jgi:outer membrane receptor protein involved in Fe transport